MPCRWRDHQSSKQPCHTHIGHSIATSLLIAEPHRPLPSSMPRSTARSLADSQSITHRQNSQSFRHRTLACGVLRPKRRSSAHRPPLKQCRHVPSQSLSLTSPLQSVLHLFGQVCACRYRQRCGDRLLLTSTGLQDHPTSQQEWQLARPGSDGPWMIDIPSLWPICSPHFRLRVSVHLVAGGGIVGALWTS